MVKKAELRKYKVYLNVDGDAARVVMAASPDEAIEAVKKILLGTDGMTPKKNAINAFCWNTGFCHASLLWSSITEEERNEQSDSEKENNEQNQGESV